ncbi:unnamed protein product [Rhizophagus irregularis]|uniref:Uncharacterized protein n=1 Tax=Rhizophagus irregularis TaxID=588596 RepID=A0A915ZPP1_9GLOM|nr:unnamed protein product [Rhizophagus irregularis]
MSRNTRSKFSQKILKNIEKTYHSTTDKEDIYRTFAPNVNNNRNRKMSNISATNNNKSHKTAEPALTSPSQTSSSVEQVPGNNSLITRDSAPHLPNAPIVETVDEMEIEVTNNNETQQLSEGSTSINGNPPLIEEIPMIDNIFSASNIQAQTSFEGLSKDNPGNSNVQSRSQPNTRGKQRQTYNNTTNHPDKTHQKSSSSWSNQQLPQEILDKIASMEQQITTLTNHVNVLQGSHQTFTEQYSSHHQQLTTIDTNIALLTHRQDSLENQHKTLMTQMQTLINTLQASQTPSP